MNSFQGTVVRVLVNRVKGKSKKFSLEIRLRIILLILDLNFKTFSPLLYVYY